MKRGTHVLAGPRSLLPACCSQNVDLDNWNRSLRGMQGLDAACALAGLLLPSWQSHAAPVESLTGCLASCIPVSTCSDQHAVFWRASSSLHRVFLFMSRARLSQAVAALVRQAANGSKAAAQLQGASTLGAATTSSTGCAARSAAKQVRHAEYMSVIDVLK